MSAHQRPESEGGFHHVYSRGVARERVFMDDLDRKAFLAALIRALRKYDVGVIAWCLMGNHVHLLLKGAVEEIGAFMRDTLSLYAKSFNRRYERVGHLFQSRYRNEPIASDEYLLQAVRYIHQNPEKAGLASTSAYRWSSYREYVGEPRITQTDLVLGMLGSVEAFVRFHRAESVFKLREYDDKRGEATTKQALLTAIDEFGEEALHEIRTLPKPERNRRIVRLRQRGVSVREIELLTGISKSAVSRVKWDS